MKSKQLVKKQFVKEIYPKYEPGENDQTKKIKKISQENEQNTKTRKKQTKRRAPGSNPLHPAE